MESGDGLEFQKSGLAMGTLLKMAGGVGARRDRERRAGGEFLLVFEARFHGSPFQRSW
jgi:hypothetical protein